eukprot:scaffold28421_cov19-Tisochrysis_lutea.AAC.2
MCDAAEKLYFAFMVCDTAAKAAFSGLQKLGCKRRFLSNRLRYGLSLVLISFSEAIRKRQPSRAACCTWVHFLGYFQGIAIPDIRAEHPQVWISKAHTVQW